ncbi:MAG: hypothetical protein M9928_14185 [Anaerolineae bacterium]|nr:hypothetical protein [Anaerolineae bacterium]MCO5206179.1 hypothetical protein [Anaerolineae bacterium]
MPQYRQGDMWSVWNTADLFAITTNSTLRTDGALVMGRGIARQARNRFPGLAAALGQAIAAACGSGGVYGLLVSPSWPDARLAAFQVKRDWRSAADRDLIHRSTALLVNWCSAHPDSQVHLNLPGIGNGRLSRDVVIPIISALPETVTIWETPAPVPASVAAHRPTVAEVPDAPLLQPPHPASPPGTVLEDWDQEAQREAYAQFIAGAAPLPVTAAERDAYLFAAGFARGCAWARARTQTRHNGRQQRHALAG